MAMEPSDRDEETINKQTHFYLQQHRSRLQLSTVPETVSDTHRRCSCVSDRWRDAESLER